MYTGYTGRQMSEVPGFNAVVGRCATYAIKPALTVVEDLRLKTVTAQFLKVTGLSMLKGTLVTGQGSCTF